MTLPGFTLPAQGSVDVVGKTPQASGLVHVQALHLTWEHGGGNCVHLSPPPYRGLGTVIGG